MAAAGGDMHAFRKMIDEGVELTNLHSDLKCTALHAAADFGKVQIVAEIIRTGMSLNIKDPRRGHTPLHFAAQSARSEVISLLLEHGADRLLTSNTGMKPFEVADKLGYFDCREMLKHLPPTVKSFEVRIFYI
jgi:ankyrin repeat protein